MSFISVLSQNVILSFAVSSVVDQDTFMFFSSHYDNFNLILQYDPSTLRNKLVGFYVHLFFQFGVPATHIYLWSRIPRNEERLRFSP